MAQRVEFDPVLAALECSPLVPLSEDEKRLLAELDLNASSPGIPHAEVSTRILARAAASEPDSK